MLLRETFEVEKVHKAIIDGNVVMFEIKAKLSSEVPGLQTQTQIHSIDNIDYSELNGPIRTWFKSELMKKNNDNNIYLLTAFELFSDHMDQRENVVLVTDYIE